MRVSCEEPSCIAQGFCSRLKQRHKATESRRMSQKKYDAKFLCVSLPQSVPRNTCTVVGDTKCSGANALAASMIPEVCLMSIAMFLPVRDLFNFVFLSNGILELLTTEIVIESAMLGGGKARKNIEKLMPLIRDRSIHVPSPQRLLRLMCAVWCEFCKRCRVRGIRGFYGVASCWDCITSRLTVKINTTTKKYNRNKYYLNAILDHPRVITKRYGMVSVGRSLSSQRYARIRHQRCGLDIIPINRHPRPSGIFGIKGRVLYMFHHPHYDSFGERCGALVTYVETQALLRDLKKVAPINPLNVTSNDLYLAYRHVTKYILQIMDAPRWNSSPYFCFEWTYLDTEDDAIEREKERNEISVARRICLGQKKVVNASLAVECVRNWICDSGAKKLLDFYVIDLPYKAGFPVIRMRYSFVHNLLQP